MPLNDDLSPAYFTGLLETAVVSVEPLGGGGNSRVFKVTAADGSRFAAKVYPGPTADGQDRLEVEFNALEFLNQRGIECVPQPIVSDKANQCAVFEFIEGSKVASHEISEGDIDQVSKFLSRLDDLKNSLDSSRFTNAAEACFSVQAIVNNLETRLARLMAANASSRADVEEFLISKFGPAFQRTITWCEERTAGAGTSMDAELGLEHRTLSPSDFGFHNALRRGDGQLVFLDFEYFGWDDPVKMISDFLLHPAMELSPSLKAHFVANVTGKNQISMARLETVFPLFGLKWCLILLNTFLPQYRLQRGHGEESPSAQTIVLERQLEKAKLMLSTVERIYERFPYRDEQHTVNVA